MGIRPPPPARGPYRSTAIATIKLSLWERFVAWWRDRQLKKCERGKHAWVDDPVTFEWFLLRPTTVPAHCKRCGTPGMRVRDLG